MHPRDASTRRLRGSQHARRDRARYAKSHQTANRDRCEHRDAHWREGIELRLSSAFFFFFRNPARQSTALPFFFDLKTSFSLSLSFSFSPFPNSTTTTKKQPPPPPLPPPPPSLPTPSLSRTLAREKTSNTSCTGAEERATKLLTPLPLLSSSRCSRPRASRPRTAPGSTEEKATVNPSAPTRACCC